MRTLKEGKMTSILMVTIGFVFIVVAFVVTVVTVDTVVTKDWVCTLTCTYKVPLPEPSASNRFRYYIPQRWCN